MLVILKLLMTANFLEKLRLLDWIDITENDNNININLEIFLDKIESLLNVMAPVKKITKRERRLQQRPWITKGILISMQNRDKIYKKFVLTADPSEKQNLFKLYKKYRNLIVTLQRKSKGNYFSHYFEKHQKVI